ncbi:MAG: GAF domain-containing protein [Chloroflexia bacterium]|nr:GAF domain-containing protein [Chloroflexia bacterium]
MARDNFVNNDMSGMTPPEQRTLSLQDLFENMSELSAVTRLEELLPHLARIFAESIGVHQCSVYLYNHDLTATSAHLRWGFSPEQIELLSLTDSASSPLMFAAERHVICVQQVLQRFVGQVDENLLPHHRAWHDAGWRGDMMVPFVWNDHVEGMAYVWPAEGEHRFHPLQIEIAEGVAKQAAGAINHLRALDAERHARRQNQALLDVNRALGSSEDRGELVQIATRAVRRILNADLASAFIFDYGHGGPATLFADSATVEELALLASDAEIPTETIPVEVELALHPRVCSIHAFGEAFGLPLHGFPKHLANLGIERAVAVPVVSRQEMLGVIYAWYRTPDGRHGQTDLTTVEAIAVELAAGLDRSALITSERRARNRAETLFSFSKILNQSIEVEEVAGSIIATVGELFPGAQVSLALDQKDPRLDVVIVPRLPFLGSSQLDELLQTAREQLSPASGEIDGFVVAAAPLTVGRDVLGSMIVAREAPASYSPDDHELLASLAPQAANAIRRAWLFSIAERHISELTLLQDVGRTIATGTSLPDIFSNIAAAIHGVVDYTTGIIALECNDPEELEVMSIWGTLPSNREGTRVPVHGSILGAVYRSQRPVVVDDVDSHPQAWSKRTAVWRSIVCVPLMSGTTAIGAMLLGHEETGFFLEGDVRLVSLLASQAGAAIYHARESERQRELYRAGVEALAAAVDAKDSYIHSHSRQVAEFSRNTAKMLGLSSEEVEQIELAGLLHDVGKIGIPDQILTKSGRLDAQERLVMISHSTLGERIVASHPALAHMARLVRHHHEWHNGSGYPDGLRGDEVPLGSAIIAVADAFGSITSYRPYRRPLSFTDACEELRKWSGIQFHPLVVDAFLASLGDPAGEEPLLPTEPSMKLQPIQSLDIIAPRILSQITTEISHLTELYPFLNRVQQIICDALKYDEVHILLTDEADGDLVLAASTTQAELVGRYRIREGEGLAGIAAVSRSVINCGDVEADSRAQLSDMGSRSMLVVPLIVEDVVIGLLGSGSVEPHRFDERDVALMRAIAGQIGPTIRVAQLHDQAKRAATTDGLTGVMNHRAFYQRLEHMLGDLDQGDDELHLLIVDVIGLKAVNDVHGHLAGDRALRAIAGALKNRVRAEDEVARYGGDEFVVIVRGTPRGGLHELVLRIGAPVAFTLENGYEMSVRLRCGFSTAYSSDDRATELVARADAGLYAQERPTERFDLVQEHQTVRFDLPREE